MNIIFGDEVEQVGENYTVLELDTFNVNGKTVKAYCLVEAQKIGLGEFASMEAYKKIHQDLIRFYHERHWGFCEQAIESLMGRWGGELNSFYTDLLKRVMQYKENPPGPDWNGSIDKN